MYTCPSFAMNPALSRGVLLVSTPPNFGLLVKATKRVGFACFESDKKTGGRASIDVTVCVVKMGL